MFEGLSHGRANTMDIGGAKNNQSTTVVLPACRFQLLSPFRPMIVNIPWMSCGQRTLSPGG